MQRVVRSSLIGLLAIAGLTACGDKVEIQAPTTTPVSNVVRSVTVSPASATLNQGDKITLAASVNADAGVTDRTVTWTSSNTAIASVDANGLVTAGTTAGTTTIVAASKADASVKGAATITVNPAPGQGAPATVTIASINQTLCTPTCVSVPANLANVAGQIDVTLNVEPGAQRLVGVDLVMNCSGNGNSGADTVVATQSLASASVAPEAEGASAPVTLSFNTATFNSSTGAVAFRNGQCTIKARARTNATAGGAIQTTTSTAQTITLNNQDVIIGSISSTKTAINPNTGLLWNGGDVTVSATPVLFSGRTAATASITFEGKTITVSGTGTQSATFTDGNGANAGGATDIDNLTDPAATPTFTYVDAAGQPITNPVTCGGGAQLCSSQSYLANPNAPTPIASIRLDTAKPISGTFSLASNVDQGTGTGGYISQNFRFVGDSAAGYRGPDAIAGNQTRNLDNRVAGIPGVDNVTVSFITRTGTGSFTTRTSASGLAESNTNATYNARMISTDALGNADTLLLGSFGVDATAPSVVTAGPPDRSTGAAPGALGNYTFTVTDNLSGPNGSPLVAQVINAPSVNQSTLAANNTISTGSTASSLNTGCIIGRWNRNSGAANASASALPVYDGTGAQIGTCSPIPVALTGTAVLASNVANVNAYVTTRFIATDVAGNATAPIDRVIVEDNAVPVVVSIDPPGTITGNSTASVAANITDNLDVVGSYATVQYPTPNGAGGAAINLQYATTAGPGVAFDNTLTMSATATPQIPNFIKSIQTNAGGAVVAPNASANATGVVVTGVDEVGNKGSLTQSFAATQLAAGSSSTFSTATFTGGFTVAANNTTLSNCPTAGCGPTNAPVAAANPTTATITATAAGTSLTFNNPFTAAVQVWYRETGGTNWFLAGNAAAGSARDNGTNRFWDYTFTFDPPASTPNGASLTPANGGSTTLQVMAIGVNTAGDAVASAPITITVTNP